MDPGLNPGSGRLFWASSCHVTIWSMSLQHQCSPIEYANQNLFWAVYRSQNCTKIWFAFVLKYKGLQLSPDIGWQCHAMSLGCPYLTQHVGQKIKWKWQNLGRNADCMSGSFTPGAIYWISILEYSIARVNMKFACLNHYLFEYYLKKFIDHNFQSCCLLKFSKNKELNLPFCWVVLCWDGFWLVYVLL